MRTNFRQKSTASFLHLTRWMSITFFLLLSISWFTAKTKSTKHEGFCLVTPFWSIFVREMEEWAFTWHFRINFSMKNLTRPSDISARKGAKDRSVWNRVKNLFSFFAASSKTFQLESMGHRYKWIDGHNWRYCQPYHTLAAYVLTIISNS